MEIRIDEKERYCIIQIDGRLVAACSEQLREIVGKRLERFNNILFDLTKMAHIDSSGLGVLVQILQRTNAQGGTTRLACLQAHPRIVFDITKVYRVFEIFDTVEEAEKAFAASAAPATEI